MTIDMRDTTQLDLPAIWAATRAATSAVPIYDQLLAERLDRAAETAPGSAGPEPPGSGP